MEQPISDVTVDTSIIDVKSKLGMEFIPRTSNLIAFGAGSLKQQLMRRLSDHSAYMLSIRNEWTRSLQMKSILS